MLLAFTALAGTRASAQVKVDPKLPSYRPVSGVSGSIKSIGSDTMNNLMALWAEGFQKFYPNVRIEVEGKGSSTAPPALISGTATFGPMSRPWKSSEIDDFEKRFGYKPVQLISSIDMLAVYVHKDNPVKTLTLAEVDAMFSKTRKLGHSEDVTTWDGVGLDGSWANRSISLFGRNSASGTYGFFKENALGKGDFKDSVKEQPGSSSVVQSIASDKFAIGYSGIGYLTSDVRAVPLSRRKGIKAVEPTPANMEKYPLSRPLLLCLNVRPNSSLDPLPREFIRFIFSKEGQQAAVKDGYLPVSAAVAKKQLKSVGIEE